MPPKVCKRDFCYIDEKGMYTTKETNVPAKFPEPVCFALESTVLGVPKAADCSDQ